MSAPNGTPVDLTAELFLTADEVGRLFRRDRRWAYRAAGPRKLLEGAARRFGTGERRLLLFDKAEIARIVGSGGAKE